MACVFGLLATGTARADGAFPDSLSIMTPAALPHEIVLATNFGLVLSPDDGQTWTWTCESAQSTNAGLYQMGPPPGNRLYAVASVGLAFSDDSSCSWTIAGGLPRGASVQDAFVDPTNVNRVLSILAQAGDGGAVFEVFESTDAGATLGTLRYTAAGADHVTGVEIAQSAPLILYLTITSGTNPLVPKVARSPDDGTTWVTHDLSSALGAGVTSIRLISVDPADPQKVYMRVASGTGVNASERVAVSADGGATIAAQLSLQGGSVTAFTRTANGHVFVAGVAGVDPVAYRSVDAGATFQPLPAPPHLRGLSARGGTIYGVADNVKDGFAIATSDDEGMTWKPLMSYDQIVAIQGCVMQMCQSDCLMRADMGQWSADFCSALPPPPPPDAGAGATGDGAAGGAAGSGPGTGGSGGKGGAGSDAATPGQPPSGCHCEAANAPASAAWAAGALAALALTLALRRRRRG